MKGKKCKTRQQRDNLPGGMNEFCMCALRIFNCQIFWYRLKRNGRDVWNARVKQSFNFLLLFQFHVVIKTKHLLKKCIQFCQKHIRLRAPRSPKARIIYSWNIHTYFILTVKIHRKLINQIILILFANKKPAYVSRNPCSCSVQIALG